MFGGEGFPGGFHRDVMDANPTDPAGRKALSEEIKNRAKGSLASKNYMEARTLYGKAIEVMSNQGEDAYVSVLYANRSMCELGMGRAEEADSDAAEALKLDPSYVKAYYRRGMALSKLYRWAEARDILQKGLLLKEDDKEMRAQLDKTIFALSNPDGTSQKATTPAVPKARSTINTTANVSTSTKPPEDSRKKSGPPPVSRPSAPEKAEVDEEDNTQYRGYKINSEGKKTTFFNNELDAQTKQLIGDIAPKKLDQAPTPLATASNPVQGSAWNTAGTFESKDLTPWAKERLAETLKLSQVSSPAVVIKVIDVTISGDGEVVAARGKRKHIYDFTAVVQWSLLLTEGPGSAGVVKGELTINDICADEDGEYTVTGFTVKSTPTPEQQSAITAQIRAASAGLQPAMFKQLDLFRREFKSK